MVVVPTGTARHFRFVHGLNFDTALALITEHDLFPRLHAFSTDICHLLARPYVHALKDFLSAEVALKLLCAAGCL